MGDPLKCFSCKQWFEDHDKLTAHTCPGAAEAATEKAETDMTYGATMIIEPTDAALRAMATVLARHKDAAAAFRIAARPGGCAGFTYELGIDTNEAGEDDVTLVFTEAVTVRTDMASLPLLRGSTIDYQDGKGFSIENPNATGSCGCGKSFS